MRPRVPRLPPDVLVELINGWGAEPRRVAGEEADPPPPEETLRRCGIDPSSAEIDDYDLRRFADRAYAVFAAAPADRSRLVAALLDEAAVRPTLSADGERITEAWLVEGRADLLAGAVALALRDLLLHAGPRRLGTCSADRCVDAFVDASPGARRRFCSVTCQGRERVAAFRRRTTLPS